MEDDLNIFENGIHPQQQKMHPKTNKSKNNNIFENGRRPNSFENGRQPQNSDPTKNN